MISIEELRPIPLFAALSDEQLRWVIDHSYEVLMKEGEAVFVEGEPANFFHVLLEGEMLVTKRSGGQEIVLITHHAGAFTGEIPLLAESPYIASGRLVRESRLLRMEAEQFRAMLTVCPPVASVLLPALAWRTQTTERLMREHEKLAALGKLAAGLAHELNNPASASLRAANQLREVSANQQSAALQLGGQLEAEQLAWLTDLRQTILEQVKQNRGKVVDVLLQSDREDALTDWLDEHDVADGWKLAPVLVAAGIDPEKLDEIASHVSEAALAPLLTWLETVLAVDELTDEIELSSGRISELVRAIKEYSYMDQAPWQEIDIHKSLESTLIILKHKLKSDIKVVRTYDPHLPRIGVYGSELNQVWTNLIDNAIDAIRGQQGREAQGQIEIRTERRGEFVVVSIIDNGPGVPSELQTRIFEPFFTTKGVGEGTGLGLDTAYRIVVNQHHGDLTLTSRPGETRFEVCLPIQAQAPTEG